MNPYRLYFIDRRDHIIKVDEVEFPSDAAALTRATELTRTHAMEVWQGERMVAHVAKGTCRQSAAA